MPLWHACMVDNPTLSSGRHRNGKANRADSRRFCFMRTKQHGYLAIIYLSLREYCGIITIFTMPEANNCLSIVSGVLSNSVVEP